PAPVSVGRTVVTVAPLTSAETTPWRKRRRLAVTVATDRKLLTAGAPPGASGSPPRSAAARWAGPGGAREPAAGPSAHRCARSRRGRRSRTARSPPERAGPVRAGPTPPWGGSRPGRSGGGGAGEAGVRMRAATGRGGAARVERSAREEPSEGSRPRSPRVETLGWRMAVPGGRREVDARRLRPGGTA